MHFLWRTLGPDSSYSLLLIHMTSKLLRLLRMLPPIQVECFRSLGETILKIL